MSGPAITEERNIANALISGLANMKETPTREQVEKKAQQIAELFAKMMRVLFIDRFQHFVNFLDDITAQRGMGLLRVPRATSRRTQAGHHIHDRFQ